MSETARDRKADSGLARFLRFLLAGGAAAEDGNGRVVAPDGRAEPVAPAVLAAALREGLVERDGAGLRPTAEARAYLKRRLCESETPFAAQHRDLAAVTVLAGGARQAATLNRLESPLSALSRLKDGSGAAYIPQTALAAGERLHADFMRGGLQPRLTMTWEPRLAARQKGGAGAREIADTALAARARVASAVTAMGPELSGVALDVCCFMKGLETVERERQWPARSAKLMLRAALMTLARHYAPPEPARRRRHAWGAQDYRPDLGNRE